MLEMRGYNVQTAKSDEQGIELLKRGNIDLKLSLASLAKPMQRVSSCPTCWLPATLNLVNRKQNQY